VLELVQQKVNVLQIVLGALGQIANWTLSARKSASSSTVCCLVTLHFFNSSKHVGTLEHVQYLKVSRILYATAIKARSSGDCRGQYPTIVKGQVQVSYREGGSPD